MSEVQPPSGLIVQVGLFRRPSVLTYEYHSSLKYSYTTRSIDN